MKRNKEINLRLTIKQQTEVINKQRKALETIKAYNEDIRDGKINYRSQDHLDVINKALQ
jgi:hypothetical protein